MKKTIKFNAEINEKGIQLEFETTGCTQTEVLGILELLKFDVLNGKAYNNETKNPETDGPSGLNIVR